MNPVSINLRSAYLAGPMRGIQDYNFPTFKAAAAWLRKMGWSVYSPAERDETDLIAMENHEKRWRLNNWDEALPLDYYMEFDLPAVCRMDAVILLPDWETSQGARLEARVATELGHPVFKLLIGDDNDAYALLSVDPIDVNTIFTVGGPLEGEEVNDFARICCEQCGPGGCGDIEPFDQGDPVAETPDALGWIDRDPGDETTANDVDTIEASGRPSDSVDMSDKLESGHDFSDILKRYFDKRDREKAQQDSDPGDENDYPKASWDIKIRTTPEYEAARWYGENVDQILPEPTDLRDSPIMRVFETGATRNVETDPDYHGFISPLALHAYGDYMHRHRLQADGTLRDSDNWQKGIPNDAFVRSMVRHVHDVQLIHDGYGELARSDNRDDNVLLAHLAATLFNVQGMLHNVMKAIMEEEV